MVGNNMERPEYEDMVIEDARGGYTVTCEGKLIDTCVEWDDALEAARRWMKRQGYYPDLYYINDHGNVDLLDDKGEILESWV